MQFSGAGRKGDKGGRTDRSLGQVFDFRTVLPAKQFDEAVELSGPNTVRSGLEALANQGEECRGALPREGRYKHHRGIIQEFQPFVNLIEEFLPISLRDRVPFVDAQ